MLGHGYFRVLRKLLELVLQQVHFAHNSVLLLAEGVYFVPLALEHELKMALRFRKLVDLVLRALGLLVYAQVNLLEAILNLFEEGYLVLVVRDEVLQREQLLVRLAQVVLAALDVLAVLLLLLVRSGEQLGDEFAHARFDFEPLEFSNLVLLLRREQL